MTQHEYDLINSILPHGRVVEIVLQYSYFKIFIFDPVFQIVQMERSHHLHKQAIGTKNN